MDGDSQCELGAREGYSEQLGFGAVVGSEIWDQQSRVRIRLGPLTFEQYRDFLPGGSAYRQLRALARFYAGNEFDVEVQLILRREEVPACELAAGEEKGCNWVGQPGSSRLRSGGTRGTPCCLYDSSRCLRSDRLLTRAARNGTGILASGADMALNMRSLISKLNDTTRSALEGAAGLCLSRTHYNVEIEHYLSKLLDAADSDFPRILKAFGVDPSRFAGGTVAQPRQAQDRQLPHPRLQPQPVPHDQRGVAGGLGGFQCRAGPLRLHHPGLASDEELSRIMREVSREWQKINPEALKKDFATIVQGSHEETAAPAAARCRTARSARRATAMGGKTPNLDQYTVNLTEKAKGGKIDPVLGRDFEIRQIIDILTRRRQNNPILTGEAGVGKTAVVEGFALRIAAGRRAGRA